MLTVEYPLVVLSISAGFSYRHVRLPSLFHDVLRRLPQQTSASPPPVVGELDDTCTADESQILDQGSSWMDETPHVGCKYQFPVQKYTHTAIR